MIEFKAGNKYRLRLMPNVNNLKKNVNHLRVQYSNNISDYYFAYVFDIDNQKMDYIKLGSQFKKFVQSCLEGFYGTSDGYLILSTEMDKPDFYYSNENKSEICTYKYESFKKHTDVVLYEEINLLDIKSEYIMNIEVYDVNAPGFNFKKFIYSLEKYNPLYSEGDDKDEIHKMYNGLKILEEIVDDFSKTLVKGKLIE